MTNHLWNEAAFEAFVESFMEKEQVPGLAVAISRGGEVIYQKGFGVRDRETLEPVTPATIFGIASVSKSFTAAAIMQLAAEGKLSVDDPVVVHLPAFRLSDGSDPSRVKIHHLLSHTTGVPPMTRREELNYFDDHLDYVASAAYEPLGEPGEYFSYCNDTFLLLGAIIERVSGRMFRRYITAELLEPLGMNRSTYSLEEVSRMQDVSVPYVKQPGQSQPLRVEWPSIGNYEAGGGIRSNVLDLLKYGELYVKGGAHEGASFCWREMASQHVAACASADEICLVRVCTEGGPCLCRRRYAGRARWRSARRLLAFWLCAGKRARRDRLVQHRPGADPRCLADCH